MGSAEIRIAERIAWQLERHFGRYGEIREIEGSGDRLFVTDYASERQLISWVLGFGEHAQVLAPAELVAELERRVELLVARHTKLADGRAAATAPPRRRPHAQQRQRRPAPRAPTRRSAPSASRGSSRSPRS